jgi:hypothetical protein
MRAVCVGATRDVYRFRGQIQDLVLGGELEEQHLKVTLPSVAAVGEQVLGPQKTRASTAEAVAVNVNWD